MKKISYILFLVLGIGFSSCEDFLDTTSPSQFTEDVVFSAVPYAQYAVNGVYNMLGTAELYGQKIPLYYSTNNDIEFAGADGTSYQDNSARGSSNYLGYVDFGDYKKTWDGLYKLIERSSIAITGIRNSPVIAAGGADATTMKALLGEVLTMRALAYFELVRHWGDVPYKTEATTFDLSNANLPPTDRDVILDGVLSDLDEAASLLPWIGTGSYSSTERISKGFVKGLTARVALARGGYSLRNKSGFPTERPDDYLKYYQIANDACKAIVANGQHKLNPSYLNIWKSLNRLELEGTYKENLFEVAFGYLQQGEMGYSIGVRAYKNTKYGYGNNTNIVNTSAYYFYSFDKDDLRKNITVAYYQYSDNTGATKEIMKVGPTDYNIGKWDQRMMSQAFIAANLGANGKVSYGINWVIMRYSDVLLMLAETENEINNGPTSIARDALKQVRSRAFTADMHDTRVDAYVDGLNGKAGFFDAIVNERAWEFGGEAIRKWDLVRWNLLTSKINTQRTVTQNMLNGIYPVTIFDKTYASLPTMLYYKYNDDNENLNRDDINFYTDKGIDDIEGYTKMAWLSGLSESNKANYLDRLDKFSSGLDRAKSLGVENRYLYPIPAIAVAESQGLLSNSYAF